MIMNFFFRFILFGCIIGFGISACNKDELLTNPESRLDFSTDTIAFDTIFTTQGSVTKVFKIYNRHDKKIRISSAYLKSGGNSKYRINIDGVSANSFENIEIPPKDSLFVFVEVTLDPVNDNNPLIVEDVVVFNTNGNTDEIVLEAYGQDVHLYKGKYIESETWTNDKPYLIIDGVAIDSGFVLTIKEGTKIYFHKNSSLIVYGKLIVKGTHENPVVFEGDRFDRGFDRSAGRWGTIFIDAESRDNVVENAIIKNAKAGFQVGYPQDEMKTPSLKLINVFIQNSSFSSIVAYGAEIEAFNCIFADAKFHGLAFLLGGKYNFYHCTISTIGAFYVKFDGYESYERDGEGYGVALTNFYFPYNTIDKNYIYVQKTLDNALVEANFYNSIIYGRKKNELFGYDRGHADFNYLFDHCLVKQNEDSLKKYASHFNEIKFNKTPRFIHDSIMTGKYNFGLDTLSPAKDSASMEIIDLHPELIFDYTGKSRILDGKPDMGAIERNE